MDTQVVAVTHPPAKLNLFLELLKRREDGFHDIDTVMVSINWHDRLILRRTEQPSIRLSCRWLPSQEIAERRLGGQRCSGSENELPRIPEGESNLVHRALSLFRDRFQIAGGFEAQLDKQIPAGAGMGGASSDAASALMAAAKLCGSKNQEHELQRLCEQIGSDVPFFLGLFRRGSSDGEAPSGDHHAPFAARAQGRGTTLSPFKSNYRPHFVVVFPGISLSTAEVYRNSSVPANPETAEDLLAAWGGNNITALHRSMMNRLTEPAIRIVPQIEEMIESMWRLGARTCQLTGSGSACFAVVDTARQARQMKTQLQSLLQRSSVSLADATTLSGRDRNQGGWVRAVTVCDLPSRVDLIPADAVQ